MIKPVHVAICLAVLHAGVARAATNPWFGTWKLKLDAPDQKPETLVYSDAGNGAMRMVSVEDKSVIVTRFDGEPAADRGAGAGRGNALAIKAVSPTSYTWTFFLAGKPRAQGKNTLSPNGRTFTESSWSVTAPANKVTLIYERQ